MSFKVGDFVLTVEPWFGSELLRIVSFRQNWEGVRYAIFSDLGFFRLSGLRHATPQEIAAGHRIDKPELEVLEMIDVSPNCEVSEL